MKQDALWFQGGEKEVNNNFTGWKKLPMLNFLNILFV